ncbi:MAG TPA: hypothetical protein DD381_12075 [Lentisphaeria bacterium]|nr:MAG: hypothetical protein A2X47_09645 [Lentisphaerae bacterium GWF2_38_69]HBM17064.1 hypothetical protein [Lentisphaeria bacterium]
MKIRRFFARNRVLLVLVGILLLFLFYYCYLHRHPRTDNAFVIANTIPISSYVSGYITDVYVENNQEVKKGDKLFTIYTTPYELALKQLEAELKAEQYNSKALANQIKQKELAYQAATAQFKNADYLALQSEWLANKNAVSDQDAEVKGSQKDVAKANLEMAATELEIIKNQYQNSLATEESLAAQVANAKVNLEMTTVYAPANGIISNMYITKGMYTAPGSALFGDALFSFIETDKWWVQANIKETELDKVKEGQKVWMKLWIYPEKVFEGKISKIGWNVNRQESSMTNFLQNVKDENEWFLLPQRFPVQVEIIDKDISKYPLHVGLTATVVINTEDYIWEHLFWQIDWW